MPCERTLLLTPDATGRLKLTGDGNDIGLSFDSFVEAIHYAASVIEDGEMFPTTLIFCDAGGNVMMKTVI